MHRYFAALAVILLSLLSLLPWLVNYWKLERKTSLSPIETAKAFGAPLLVDGSGNAPINLMLKDVGARRAHFGEQGNEIVGLEGYLRLGDPDATVIPKRRMAYT